MSSWAAGQENEAPVRVPSTAALDQWLHLVENGSRDQRLQAVYAPPAGANPARTIAALTKLAGNIQNDIRAGAIHTLGQMKDPASLPLFLAALDDRSPRVREAAVWALNNAGFMDASSAVARLLEDRDSKVRVAATWYFAQTVPAAEREPIVELLNAPEGDVRTAAVWGLATSTQDFHRSAARRLFDDPSPRVRQAAAWAFSEANDIASIGELYRGLADPATDVRYAMAGGLEKLGEPGGAMALRLMDGETVTWDGLREKIEPGFAVPFLIALLEASDGLVRRNSARLIGEARAIAARPHLLALSRSQIPGERLAATAALAELDDAGPVGKSLRVAWSLVSSVLFFGAALVLALLVLIILHRRTGAARRSAG